MQREINDASLREYGRVVQGHINQQMNTAKEERLRTRTKEEFAGTLTFGKGEDSFPILITGSQADHTLSGILKEFSRNKYKTERAIKDAEKRLRPTPDEIEFAHGMVSGNNTLEKGNCNAKVCTRT